MPVFTSCFYKLLLDFPFSLSGVVYTGQEASESGIKAVPNMHNEDRKRF